MKGFLQKSFIWVKATKRNKPMKQKGNKWEGKISQFKKRSKKRRKDEDIIVDNVVMVEEGGYIIKDGKGNMVHPNNKMACDIFILWLWKGEEIPFGVLWAEEGIEIWV